MSDGMEGLDLDTVLNMSEGKPDVGGSDNTETPQAPKEEPTSLAELGEDESQMGEETTSVEEPEEGVVSPSNISIKGVDGQEIEIPLDAKISVTIDGEDREIPISEYRDRLSSHVHVQRRLEKIGRDEEVYRKAQEGFHNQRDRFAAVVDGMNTILKVGGPEDLAEFFGHLTSSDPQQLLNHWVGNIQAALQDAETLTPEQRAAKRQLQKAAVLSRLQESGKAAQNERERQRREDQEIADEVQMFNLQRNEMDEATGDFVREWRAGNIQLVDKEGKPRQPDRYDVIDYALRQSEIREFSKIVKIEDNKKRQKILAHLADKAVKLESDLGRRLKPEERKKAVSIVMGKVINKATATKEPLRGMSSPRAKVVGPIPEGESVAFSLFPDNFKEN